MKYSHPAWWTALVICLTVVLPRFAALGGFPNMDEGFYAFIARYIYNGYATTGMFPADLGGYQLYPFLLAWIPALPGNELFWFRLADLFFATLAGWFFCRMLVEESGSLKFGLLLASAFLLGMNVPDAIESGFKHSFFPAFTCLFLAVNLARKAGGSSNGWFWVGGLVALGVLLRETFAPFAILGCVALLWTRAFGALWRYVLGGIGAALAITAVCALCRGQFAEIFAAYVQAASVYEPEAARVWPNFMEYGFLALKTFLPLLVLMAGAAWLLARQKAKCSWGRPLFWLSAVCMPLFEPFFKLGFLYHFTVCLPGIAGFCACAYGRIAPDAMKTRRNACIVVVICLCMLAPCIKGHFKNVRLTLAVLETFPRLDWPENADQFCQTLAVARSIKEHMPENGSLAANGFTFFLFPASGESANALWQADLARAYLAYGRDNVLMSDAFVRQPPDLVVLAEAVKPHAATFARELRAIISNNPSYEFVERIEPSLNKNYGWLGYSLYRKTRPEKR